MKKEFSLTVAAIGLAHNIGSAAELQYNPPVKVETETTLSSQLRQLQLRPLLAEFQPKFAYVCDEYHGSGNLHPTKLYLFEKQDPDGKDGKLFATFQYVNDVPVSDGSNNRVFQTAKLDSSWQSKLSSDGIKGLTEGSVYVAKAKTYAEWNGSKYKKHTYYLVFNPKTQKLFFHDGAGPIALPNQAQFEGQCKPTSLSAIQRENRKVLNSPEQELAPPEQIHVEFRAPEASEEAPPAPEAPKDYEHILDVAPSTPAT